MGISPVPEKDRILDLTDMRRSCLIAQRSESCPAQRVWEEESKTPEVATNDYSRKRHGELVQGLRKSVISNQQHNKEPAISVPQIHTFTKTVLCSEKAQNSCYFSLFDSRLIVDVRYWKPSRVTNENV